MDFAEEMRLHTRRIDRTDHLTVGAVLVQMDNGIRNRITAIEQDAYGTWYSMVLHLEPVDAPRALTPTPGERPWTPWGLNVTNIIRGNGHRLVVDPAVAQMPTAEYAARFGLSAATPNLVWLPY